jgi:hypothetical protein
MNSTDSNIKIISPFLGIIAIFFYFIRFFDDLDIPSSRNINSFLTNRNAVCVIVHNTS